MCDFKEARHESPISHDTIGHVDISICTMITMVLAETGNVKTVTIRRPESPDGSSRVQYYLVMMKT